MKRAVCPGSFDPVTRGHLDVIGRAAGLFDEVIVAVGSNSAKQPLFSVEERIAMLEQASAGFGGVRAVPFSGLLADFCREQGAAAIVKGLRFAADFDYELPMAQMNHTLTGVDTVFVPTSPQWSFVSSSLVREVAALGGDVASFLPDGVAEATVRRIAERSR